MNSEFDIIRRYFTRPSRRALLGVGDDAAIITCRTGMDLVASTDTLVADRHFFAHTDPANLGHKSLAVNLSDMAAMGATPRWVMLSLTIPRELAQDDAWLNAFSSGFFTLADQFDVELIGGDTTCGPLNIGVQIMGEIQHGRALKRSTAVAGDDIWVSGELGNAALALGYLRRKIVLTPQEAQACLSHLDKPVPRVGLGQQLQKLASSAIDISDGLLADLGHILRSSGIGAKVDFERIPCSSALRKKLMPGHLERKLAMDCLLAGGDDYELCFTAAANNHEALVQLSQQSNIQLSCIGEIVTGDGLTLSTVAGVPIHHERKGHDHFLA
ncbi:thiamine-phosphate kinase [Nitrosomonas mobilis]|uniref:Thiamine-monophosphate kinase n=1 Tax=Nitrosomonas mobilis TaxID=51642 RepID=A0A1G5SD07_9PROT|nr:thiamine-phosphate kinase [Nitrosomonas mobilis]SCZ85073.1 thiamin-monophosphate kinase [Nitrosomonas mobilis]HNO74672.1 thiamine-phosphate kinase [Nitrosomonas mobilis]